jgi:hypothetical protein
MRASLQRIILLIVFFLVAIILSPILFAAQKPDILALQLEAWQKLIGPRPDVEGFRELVAPDFIYIGDNGAFHTLEENLAILRQCSFASFSLTDPQVRWLSSTSAVIFYHLNIDGVYKGHKIPNEYESTNVWTKRNGRWVIQLYSEALVADSSVSAGSR